jgi:hypothetical protein
MPYLTRKKIKGLYGWHNHEENNVWNEQLTEDRTAGVRVESVSAVTWTLHHIKLCTLLKQGRCCSKSVFHNAAARRNRMNTLFLEPLTLAI